MLSYGSCICIVEGYLEVGDKLVEAYEVYTIGYHVGVKPIGGRTCKV